MNIDELFIYSKKLTVLFVEDDLAVKESTAKIFKKFYKDVTVCSAGKEALAAYKEESFDILITDLNLDDMDGIELITKVKEINPNQSIVVLSGFIDKYANSLRKLDVNAVLLKPYRLSKLLYTLLKISENVTLYKEFGEELHIVKRDSDKVSANSYLKQLSKDKDYKEKIDFDIEKLLLLAEELEHNVEDMLKNQDNKNHLEDLSDIMHKITNCLLDFNDFKIVSDTIAEFSTFLLDLKNKESDIDVSIYPLIECLCIDIKTFIDNMFVTKDVSDINYFTDSFKNNFELLKSESGFATKQADCTVIFL
jgi:YesN/AraC family two-component response regulator